MSLQNLLTQTAQVQKVSTSAASTGGVVNTYADRIASVACLFNQRRRLAGSEQSEFGKMTLRDENVLYMQATGSALNIIPSDRIVIDSTTFEVTSKPYNAGNRSVVLQVELEEIEI